MYNYFKHKQQQQNKEIELKQKRQYEKYLRDYDNFKKISHQNYCLKVHSFVENNQKEPFILQDDHFQVWKKNISFRDTENPTKFLGFKSFVHRSNMDMSSVLNQRQRKQKSQNKQILNEKKIIKPQLLLRNIQSQGPFIQKSHSYRPQLKNDSQPPLKFKYITDREKFVEQFTQQPKFLDSVYRNFKQTKGKIGVIRTRPITPKKNGQNLNVHVSNSLNQSLKNSKSKKPIIQNLEQSSQYIFQNANKTKQKINDIITKINTNHLLPPKRAYFKAAKELGIGKTISLKNQQKQKQVQNLTQRVLKNCQYDRKKYLQNIVNNTNYESYRHGPVL